jgi:hypothetical protein
MTDERRYQRPAGKVRMSCAHCGHEIVQRTTVCAACGSAILAPKHAEDGADDPPPPDTAGADRRRPWFRRIFARRADERPAD